jgi:hypothetical protein
MSEVITQPEILKKELKSRKPIRPLELKDYSNLKFISQDKGK